MLHSTAKPKGESLHTEREDQHSQREKHHGAMHAETKRGRETAHKETMTAYTINRQREETDKHNNNSKKKKKKIMKKTLDKRG